MLPPMTPMMKLSGVYAIANTQNGLLYIGSATTSFRARWRVHVNDLINGRHSNKRLQRSFAAHGPDRFRFSVLLVCAPKDCLFYEQLFIDNLNVCDPRFGYNVCRKAGNSAGVIKSAETRAKLSAALKGKNRGPKSLEARAAMSVAKKGIAPVQAIEACRGRKATPEERARMSASRKGKKKPPFTAAHRAALSAACRGKKLSEEHKAKWRGKKASPETRAKLSVARKGKKRPRTAEHQAAITASLMGRIVSPETRAKISAANKAAHRRKLSLRQLTLVFQD